MASRMGALLHREPIAIGVGEEKKNEAAAAAANAPDDEEKGAAAARAIAMGDMVIVYEGFGKQKAVTLTERGQYQNRYGNFFHRDWVGRPYGCKVFGKGNAGFVWLLAGRGDDGGARGENKQLRFPSTFCSPSAISLAEVVLTRQRFVQPSRFLYPPPPTMPVRLDLS